MNKADVLLVPCADPDCKDGKIEVFYAWGEDPFTPVEEPCEICSGLGKIPVQFSSGQVH